MNEKITVKDISKMIDHSLLAQTLTEQQMVDGCKVAVEQDAASVCVKPYHVARAAEELKGTDVLVGAVIGFPHGNSTLEIKVAETEQVIKDGAVEVDMVVNLAKVIEGDRDFLEKEIGTITEICHKNNAIVKVIFAVDLIEDKHIIQLCEICTKVKADFVKTSTGYNYVKTDDGKYTYYGATDHALKLMRKHSGTEVQVKAAGCVRTLSAFLNVRAIGCTRVGTSQTIAVVEEAKKCADENGVLKIEEVEGCTAAPNTGY